MGRRRKIITQREYDKLQKTSEGRQKIYLTYCVVSVLIFITCLIAGIILSRSEYLTDLSSFAFVGAGISVFVGIIFLILFFTERASLSYDTSEQIPSTPNVEDNLNDDFGDEFDEYGGYPEPIEITENHYKNNDNANLIKGNDSNIHTTQDNIYNRDYELWYRRKLFDIKNELLYSQNLELSKIKAKIELAESYELRCEQQHITLHFFYNDMLGIVYSLRDNEPSAIDYCLQLCDKDIAILPKISLPDASIPSITRKAIILEKQHRIEEAIQLCDYAIEHNYLDNKKSFSLRKIKLQKKTSSLH